MNRISYDWKKYEMKREEIESTEIGVQGISLVKNKAQEYVIGYWCIYPIINVEMLAQA